MNKIMKKTFVTLIALTSLALGCASSPEDEDALRSAATAIEMGQVIQEVISPTNGDLIDWKMVTVPGPGTIKIELVLVNKDDIFGAEIAIYDRFGIPVKEQNVDTQTTTNQKFLVLTAVLPEPGLHFIKISAEGGETDYTVTVLDFEMASGYELISNEAPSFTLDEEVETAEVPTAEAETPSKSGKTKSRSNDDDDDNAKKTTKKSTKSSASSDDDGAIKPIVADLKGKYDSIEGKVVGITAKGSGAQIRINLGSQDGIREGAVGEIYDASGKWIKGARFKVNKISGKSSQCQTNATPDDLDGAQKVVVKSPK